MCIPFIESWGRGRLERGEGTEDRLGRGERERRREDKGTEDWEGRKGREEEQKEKESIV